MPHPKGGYKIDGKPGPGVTTIIGRFKDSGGLLHWAFGQGRLCERGEINSLYDNRDKAADAGTLAHAMVEACISKTEFKPPADTPDEILQQAEQGFKNFLSWEENNLLTITNQEEMLLSTEHKFGGCIDGAGLDTSARRCLIDWKTGSGLYVDYLLQMAAYGILWDENYPDDKIKGGYHLCRFSKENADFHHHFFFNLDDAKEYFILLRKAYDLDKKLKKRI